MLRQEVMFFLFFTLPYLLVCNCKLYTVNSSLSSMLSSISYSAPLYASDNGKFAVDSYYSYAGMSSCAVYVVEPNWSMGSIWVANEFEYQQWDENNEVNALEVRNDGNLIFYFHTGNKYESFSHPHDILLPNQTLKTGMSLISGEFSASVDYNGIFITNSMNTKSQAWMFGRDCNSSMTEVQYTGTHLRFSNGCREFSFRTSNSSMAPNSPYLQLDPDSGDFVSYMHIHMHYESVDQSEMIKDSRTLDLANSMDGMVNLKFENTTLRFQCKITDRNRGICGGTGNCDCLEGPADDVTDYMFAATDYWFIPNDSVVLKRAGILVFYPPKTLKFFDTCRSQCLLSNKTECLAFLFDNQSYHCFFIPGPGSIYYNASFSIRQHEYSDKDHFTINGAFLVLIVPGVAAAAWFAALCMLVVVQKRLKVSPKKEIEILLASMQSLPQRFSYISLDTATRGFRDKLGSGGYGSVYKGVLHDGRSVAVKKLNTAAGTQGVKEFVTEAAGMGGISHVNVVKLCGFCIEATTTECLLVYDLMPNGSLDKWLFESEKHQAFLTWQQRIDIALGTAQGLYYLHEECSEPILHLDIKPQNILLDEKFTAKIADFGMAKLLENRDITQVHTCMRGTPGYMAPEWLTHFTATKKSDVFSYGMVVLELISGRRNVDLSKMNISSDDKLDEYEEDGGWYFPAWVARQANKGNLLGVVDQKVRDSACQMIQQVKMIVHLALWCIQGNPNTRPSMQTVVQVLQGHLELGQAPSLLAFSDNPSMFSWSSYSEGSSLLNAQKG